AFGVGIVVVAGAGGGAGDGDHHIIQRGAACRQGRGRAEQRGAGDEAALAGAVEADGEELDVVGSAEHAVGAGLDRGGVGNTVRVCLGGADAPRHVVDAV